MKRSIFCSILAAVFCVMAVLSSGGCGGSSSSKKYHTSGRTSIFVGTTGGSLYSALESKLNFTVKLTEQAGADSVDSLTEGDILVFDAGYFDSMDSKKTELLTTAYSNNATIALLDADNIQINTMRTTLGLISDDSIPTKESWEQDVAERGYTTSGDWTGTVSLYALAKRDNDDGIYWNGANTMTYIIPDATAFASSVLAEEHINTNVDENGELISPDLTQLESIDQELQEDLQDLWDSIMTGCGFTEGVAGTSTDVSSNGTPAVAAYNGSDTLSVTGDIGDGEITTITLTKAEDGTISFTMSDNLWAEVGEELDKEIDLSGELRRYHERRVQSFIDWCDGLEEINSAMAADKADIIAAADNEVKLADLNGDSRTWNASPPAKQKTLTIHKVGIQANDINKTITVNRDQQITIYTYPIHNFTDGSDWYIVRLGGTLNPSGQYNRKDQKGSYDIVWGHTGYYTLGMSLQAEIPAVFTTLINTDGITLMDSSPKNINRSTTKSVGLTLNLNGKLGYSEKMGANAEIGGGISKTNTTTYQINDYENLNDSSGVTAKVQYNFAHPTKGSKSDGFKGDGLEDAVYTSRAAFNPDVQAVWKVDKSHWQQLNMYRKITVTLDWADSIARGNACSFWVTVYGEKQEDYPETITPYVFTPPAPMHFALGKKKIEANNQEQAYSFAILSEGNWTAEMDSDTAEWCTLNQTSGSATNGDEEKLMMATLKANNTNSIREGKITFRLRNIINGTEERHNLSIIQSNTERLNN